MISNEKEAACFSWLQSVARGHLLLLTGLALCCLIPFIGKAFNIDDTLFVWCGKQIQLHPFNPYGFFINWYGAPSPMSVVMRNPPLTPYFIALVGSLAGWSEAALHSAFLLPMIASVLGMYALAKQWCNNPLLATLIGFTTPAFFVSSTTVMCDVMMLAFEIWAFVFWVRAHEEKKFPYFLLSSVLLTACVLTKFSGLTILPLLIVYSCIRERKLIVSNLYLLIPLVGLAIYMAAISSMYGEGSIIEGLVLATSAGGSKPFEWARVVVGLSFLGGCFFPVLIFSPLLWSRKIVVGGFIVMAVLMIEVIMGRLLSNVVLQHMAMVNPILGSQLLVFSAGGIFLLALAIKEIIRYRDASSVTLGLLVLGTTVFAIFFSWAVAARYFLPLTPAVGIMIVRAIDQSAKKTWGYLLLIPSAALAITVASADYSLANSAKNAAQEITSKYQQRNKPLWFQGHWGFQYYMELNGAKPLNVQYPEIRSGEILIIPLNNDIRSINADLMKVQEKLDYPVASYAATMSKPDGAGFYANAWGPFPFVFGNVAQETYYVLLAQ